ncbi:MAG: Stp1/IreP family PP2C-type Ser/Thr phosphatase [Chloroflexi bacterium]|nr:Stp1/IreP family PP2C-type Ser/Thr phosphatase [Chloroflexota bacterium]
MQFLRNLLGREKSTISASQPSTPPTLTKLKVGWATDVGMARRHNEDAVVAVMAVHDGDEALPAFGFFALADGMGGHQAGEVASSLAARTVVHQVVHYLYLPTLVQSEYNTDQPTLDEVLVNAVQAANSAVANQVPGGGTTLTCALLLGPRAYIAHVGDSRAYVVTEANGLEQITHDHSLVDRLVELGQLTRDEAAAHPQKNVLYRAIGQQGVLEVETHVRTIPEKERLLLCSDGLWGMVSDAEMADIITAAPSPQVACENLIASANQAGGHDNITVVLIEPPLG